MKYRTLGNTEFSVSEIGLGCEGFADKDLAFTRDMFACARDGGINCLDLYTSDPDLRSRVGDALKDCRKDFIIQGHLCTVWKNGQYEATRDFSEVCASFDDLLARLSTDYIDIGMIHYVDSLDTWKKVCNNGILRYAEDLKAAGKIREIGLSSHNPIVALEAIRSGLIRVLMFSVNPCYDLQPAGEDVEELWADKNYEKELLNMDPDRQTLYEACQSMGVGITVMKAFGGGDLLTSDSPAGVALTAAQCIHYALTRPAVASVLCGAHSLEELAASLAYETASDAEKDYAAALASFPRISWRGHCMYCGHCAPCPKEIDVAAVTKFLNLAKAQGMIPETIRGHYDALAHSAGECVECGACEKRCPFEVPIRENMRQARELFGK